MTTEAQRFELSTVDHRGHLAAAVDFHHVADLPCPDLVKLTIPKSDPPPPKFGFQPNVLISMALISAALSPKDVRRCPYFAYHAIPGSYKVTLTIIIPTLLFPMTGGVGFEVNGLAWWMHDSDYGPFPDWFDSQSLRTRNQQAGWNPPQNVVDFIAEHMADRVRQERKAREEVEHELEAIRAEMPPYPPDDPEGHTAESIARHLSLFLANKIRDQTVLRHAGAMGLYQPGKPGERVSFNNPQMKKIVHRILKRSQAGKRQRAIWHQAPD
jgi:hypothetical protein